MKKLQFILLGLLFGLSLAGRAADVQSLRGAMDIEDPSAPVDIKKVQPDRDPIPRDYVQQPPLIPHKIDNYKITLKFNKCLTCHSWKNYKRYGATKISQTHFEDRDACPHAVTSAPSAMYPRWMPSRWWRTSSNPSKPFAESTHRAR